MFGTAGQIGAVQEWLGDFFLYATSGFLWSGALIAVEITALAMTCGLFLGLGLALVRLSRFALLRGIAAPYIFFTRGTPQLLQLVFIFDALPHVGLRLDSFTTAVIGVALNEAAFSAEIIRGGIVSVSATQSASAASLGMGLWLTLRRIVLPQAMRAIIPGLINDTISMLKLTSIASVIFVNELTFRAQQIVGHRRNLFGADERDRRAADRARTALRPRQGPQPRGAMAPPARHRPPGRQPGPALSQPTRLARRLSRSSR